MSQAYANQGYQGNDIFKSELQFMDQFEEMVGQEEQKREEIDD
jgi:exonuclease III